MNTSRERTIVLHVVAWTVYVFLYATIWRDSNDTFRESIAINLWLLPPKLFLVYTALGVLCPQLLHKRRYGLFIVSIVLLSLTGGILNQLMIHFLVPSSVGVVDTGERFWDIARISKRMTYLNSPLLFALAVEGIGMWYEQKEINTRLTKEKLAAELALLKGQLHPHFFFNTLNNLYSLTLQKSDLAPALILRLSDIMRYILDDSKKDWVMLRHELEFVRGYIDIEQVRYAGKVSVTTEWPAETDNCQIPPLTLFTFIENAFKHGVANEVETAWIDVKLSIEGEHLLYTVRNSCPEIRNGALLTKGACIGLKNTEERLKILYGPDVQFAAKRSNGVFEASFKIKNKR